MSDDELLEFCRSEYPRLVGLLGLYCGDDAVGQELAQEVLARVWRKWNRVRRLDNPQALAHRVGMNLARSHFRRLAAERRARARLVGRERVELPVSVEALAMRAAIKALPRRQREALVLHYFVDLSVTVIADRMRTSESTVKSLLHRGLARLRSESGLRDLMEVNDVS